MGKKKVTFSSLVKVVSDDGEIRYERDWGVTPFDFLAQTENIDFIQQQFEKKLSILGHAGKEDLERLQELSIPFFQCATTVVEKMGAVEYLRLLAETPICGSMPTTHNKARGIMMATLPKKKTDQRFRHAKKTGIYRPKEIPGRDSPEQRKQILMSRRQQPRIFEKYYSSLKKHSTRKPTSILKMTTNDVDAKPIIDLTYIDQNTLFGEDGVDNHWSWDDETVDEQRDQPEEGRFIRSMYDTSTRWVPRKVSRLSEDSSSRQDPPGFLAMEDSSLMTNGTIVASCRKPDPRNQIQHGSSPPSLRYGHLLSRGTSRQEVPAE
jgi:hypothetical protein